MKQIAIAFFLIITSFGAYSQDITFDCDDLQVKELIEFEHERNPPLKPDLCYGHEDYGTSMRMLYAPQEGYTVTYYKVKLTAVYEIDPKTCKVDMTITERDTIPVDTDLYAEREGETTGGYYTVQMEMSIKPEESRPVEMDLGDIRLSSDEDNLVYVSKLPSGKFQGYWIVHCGRFNTKEKAQKAAAIIRKTEWCSSFVRFLDTGVEFQGVYEEN